MPPDKGLSERSRVGFVLKSAIPLLLKVLHIQKLVEHPFDNGRELVARDHVLPCLDQVVALELWEMRSIYCGVHPMIGLAVVFVLPDLAPDQELDEFADPRLRLPFGGGEQYLATTIVLHQFDRSPGIDRISTLGRR